jgi:hypothetical protein
MSEFKKFRKKNLVEIRPYVEGEDLSKLSSKNVGHKPTVGDMIVRDPEKPSDQWLITAEYFAANYEPVRLLKNPFS